MGLLTASKRYDESKGFRFSSYAVWWIRQNKASGHLDQVLGRKPTVDELAAYLEVSVQTVANLLSEAGACISIYEPLNREEQFTPIDFLRTDTPDPDDKVMYESIKTEIQYAMQVLDKRGREILIITKEHAGRLKTRALSQLRNCSHAGELRSYLS